MPDFLGFDTSNYTTSCAIYNSETGEIVQSKKLLPVKHGELGLRQSDAVFHHVKQLPEVIRGLFDVKEKISAVGVSVRPRNSENSYMPCFLCGKAAAESAAFALNVPLFETSHQTGHILAALYSADMLNLIESPFYAFHVSGGTTDLLYCRPSNDNIIDIERIGGTDDLNAGQAIDRVGVSLGLSFPCGIELERLALDSELNLCGNVSVKDLNCSLSGLQNKCEKMLSDNIDKCDIARFCLEYIAKSVLKIAQNAKNKDDLPILFAGGVMSDKILQENLKASLEDCYFAAPQFSCDNAAGCAIYAYLKHKKDK